MRSLQPPPHHATAEDRREWLEARCAELSNGYIGKITFLAACGMMKMTAIDAEALYETHRPKIISTPRMFGTKAELNGFVSGLSKREPGE